MHDMLWRLDGLASPSVKELRSRPRSLGEYRAFYHLWSRQIFDFCLLVCGDRAQAEWLTEETFAWYFRRADFVALRLGSRVPVGLLRSAAELARTQGNRRLGADSGGFGQALLEMPFTDRAAFILVSVLEVEPSAAAVALRLSSSQLTSRWLAAALRLHGLRHAFGEATEMPAAA